MVFKKEDFQLCDECPRKIYYSHLNAVFCPECGEEHKEVCDSCYGGDELCEVCEFKLNPYCEECYEDLKDCTCEKEKQ